MARVQNTLIGKSSGSVGGATFSSWKGINVLKSKAIVVGNPKTQLQRNQRQKMSILVAIFRAVSGAINIGFKGLAVQKSAYNAFVQANLIEANFSGNAPSVVIDPELILLAKGTMGETPILLVTGTNANANVPITWNPALNPLGSSPGDIAVGAVFNETKNEWGYIDTAIRSAGTTTVIMPTSVATADVLHGYLFFRNPVTNEVSDSYYATAVV